MGIIAQAVMFEVAESAPMKRVSGPKNLPHSLLRNY